MEQQPFIQGNYRQENHFEIINNKNKLSSKSLLIICQLLLWFFILFTIANPNLFPILFLVYFIYIIIELASNTSRFLLNKKSTNSIYDKLKTIFSTPPNIKLSCECFHYERHLEERRDKNGNIITEEVERKNITYSGSEYFPYYSFRDISGLFKIDLNSDIFKNKNYIQLHLDTIISFADAISYSDYQAFKNNFIYQNNHRDQRMDFREDFCIPNMSKINLIKIKETEPIYVNFFIFCLCVVFTMGLPYELLLDNISIVGKFQIKKIISTRYNLNSIENNNIYGMSVPSIKLGKNEFNFIPEDYGNYNENMEVNLPTLEEIEKAKEFENKIQYPVFDDGSDAAPISSSTPDLPTEEELYKHKKNE